MKLYIYMVMGGSICTLLYIIFNYILPHEFELRWKSIFLKINIIFYLLPIPWLAAQLKGILKWMLEKIGIVFQIGKLPDTSYPNNIWESMVIMNENNEIIYLTGYQQWIPIILIVSAIFFALILRWIIIYQVTGKNYKKDIIYTDMNGYVEDIKRGRKIRIGVSSHINSPVTIGIITPHILLPMDYEKYGGSTRGIIRHEVNHILGMDGLFRFFTFMIVAMEWYNPLAYYLLRENIAVSEMLCDKAAVDGMSKEEKVSYMRCMIEAVGKTKDSETLIMALGKTKGLSKERMKRIMGKNEKKVWKRSLAAGIMVFCFLVSSFPALAYKEPVKLIVTNDSDNTLEEWKHVDMVTFTPEGEAEPDYMKMVDFGRSNNVFINEMGEVYSYENPESYDQNQIKAVCAHSYETGTDSNHTLKGDGSCKVVTRDAQRCTKCGNTIVGSEISTNTYKPCPH